MTVILCGAGRVKHAEMLQRTPEIADKEAVQLPAGGVPEVSLMTVSQVELMTVTALEDKAFVELKTGEQFLAALRVRTEIGVTDPVGISGLFLLEIMVPIEKVKPVLAVEEGEEPEHIVVDLDDLAHPSVFPELVAVAKLNIGEALCVIMLQGSKVKILIFQKIVVGCSVAPVAVTEKTEAAAGGYRDRGGISESPLKTGMTAHFCLAPFMQRRIRRTEKGSSL